CGQGTHLPFTF
nr:immunoglobulin light chain junction region [Macaca mulatta]MOW40725.1 immunoglobulin light chain junction region [Macaca mulatta]MOW41330.1 immunoglobulin light chain junction region [Macaca mulatta]MOW41662.1 immunoglobulin light chain junction region [Macaca mulatta]MOW42058.1 immunoglobulin light chain junction region [Macaca mulatta]